MEAVVEAAAEASETTITTTQAMVWATATPAVEAAWAAEAVVLEATDPAGLVAPAVLAALEVAPEALYILSTCVAYPSV